MWVFFWALYYSLSLCQSHADLMPKFLCNDSWYLARPWPWPLLLHLHFRLCLSNSIKIVGIFFFIRIVSNVSHVDLDRVDIFTMLSLLIYGHSLSLNLYNSPKSNLCCHCLFFSHCLYSLLSKDPGTL